MLSHFILITCLIALSVSDDLFMVKEFENGGARMVRISQIFGYSESVTKVVKKIATSVVLKD